MIPTLPVPQVSSRLIARYIFCHFSTLIFALSEFKTFFVTDNFSWAYGDVRLPKFTSRQFWEHFTKVWLLLDRCILPVEAVFIQNSISFKI